MDALYRTGIEWVLLLQAAAWLDAPMRFFTFLGTSDFFYMVLPVVYWCIDSALGIRIGLILLFGNAFSGMAKLAFHEPRPYWISAGVKALSAEQSFGIPSSHAQLAAGVWGTMAARLARPWAWIAALTIIFLIGLSRLYLAVHFPQDVLVGWLLGGLTLWAFLSLWDRLAAWLKPRSLLELALLILTIAAGLLLANGLLVNAVRDHSLPPEWLANASRLGGPPPPQVSMESMVTACGAFIGFSFGLIWIGRSGGFAPSGPVEKRLLCYLVGVVGVALLYLGLRAVFPSGDSALANSLRLVRYALLGAWITAGAPCLFARLGLMQRPAS